MRKTVTSTHSRSPAIGLSLLMCLVVAMAADLFGWSAALDAELGAVWFTLRGERRSAHRVVLVAADPETVATWGPPPWPAEREDEVRTQVQRHGPMQVVLVEPGRVFSSAKIEPLPPPPMSSVGLTALPGAWVGLDGVDRVAINYIGAPQRVPTVSMAGVAKGAIPTAFFADRVVVVGLTDPRFANRWPTPVGWATPAHLVAHALSGLDDGVALHAPPFWLRWLLLLPFAALALLVGGRGRALRAWVVPSLIAGVVIALDGASFAHGVVRLGAATTLFALLNAAIVNVNRRYRLLKLTLAVIRQVTAARRRDEADHQRDDSMRWQRLAGLCRDAFGANGAALGVLAADQKTIEYRGFVGIAPEALIGRAHDRTLPPYAAAFARGRPMPTVRMGSADQDVRTLLIPLMDHDVPVGVWLLNITEGKLLAPESRALERMQERIGRLVARMIRARVGGAGSPLDVSEAQRGVGALARHLSLLQSACEQMPDGLLIADLWGEIRLINDQMRARVSEAAGEAAARITRQGIVETLAALCGWPPMRAHSEVAAVLGERDEVRPVPGLRLRRLDVVEEGPSGGPATFFLLTAFAAGVVEATAGPVPDDEGPVRIDVRALLLRTGRGAGAEGMRIEYEFSDPTPRVECDAAALEAALDALFAEIARYSAVGAITTVSVTAGEGEVQVLLMNDSYAVPREALTDLFSDGGRSRGAVTERVQIARDAATRAGGRLDATSDPRSGVVFHLALPAVEAEAR
ncbi:MAG: CHASE2 domain-containing protein [Myxococcales bacterium]|nr:CHASE2 domain-containing protein [Myxococcales bacterium]